MMHYLSPQLQGWGLIASHNQEIKDACAGGNQPASEPRPSPDNHELASGWPRLSGAGLPAFLFAAGEPHDIARPTRERGTDLLHSFEVDPARPALLQPPQSGVADARLLGQPVKRPPALFK